VTCGNLGCSAGRCNCPAGQTFSGGSCRLNDGQACTLGGGTPCLNGCTQWFTDCDGDGFTPSSTPAVTRCGTAPPAGTPQGCGAQGRFVQRDAQGRTDCCDTDQRANPNQTGSFTSVRSGGCPGLPGDFNCNGREEQSFLSGLGTCLPGADPCNLDSAVAIRSGFADCEAFGNSNNCDTIGLVWLGGQPAKCGELGTGASQCLTVDGVCQSISGFGVDVACR
jgi:hypothetical protein